jgi:hypothetical protein
VCIGWQHKNTQRVLAGMLVVEETPVVQEAGCYALMKLMCEDNMRVAPVAEDNGIEVVLAVLRRHSGVFMVVHRALQVRVCPAAWHGSVP